MTEAEWLAGSDPTAMLIHLGRRVTDRKGRLFAVACCRRVQHLLRGEWSHTALDAAERYADGAIGVSEMREWRVVARPAPPSRSHPPTQAVAEATHERRVNPGVVAGLVADSVADTEAQMGLWQQVRSAEQAAQSAILRDVFGNPFRPVVLAPSLLTSTVVSLAATIYANNSFELMPILADALLDSDCADDRILDHCRGHQEHWKGCWVIDLILGKE